ncbi:MAG: O-antigen ligase family protein [Candidatus Gracilibacteria bacterium]
MFQFETLIYSNSEAIALGTDAIWTRSYLHISEILLLLFFFSYFARLVFIQNTKNIKIPSLQIYSILGIFIGIVTSYFFASDPWLHILRSRHVLEGILLFYILYSDRSLHKTVLYTVVFGALFQSILMVLQFLLNSSLGLWFFKEPVLSAEDLTTAKFHISGENHIRAYGTFLHPNIAAGVLSLSLFLIFYFKKSLSFLTSWQYNSITFLILAGILASVSKTAYFILLSTLVVWVCIRSAKTSHIFTSLQERTSSLLVIEKDILRILWAILMLAAVFFLLFSSIFLFFDSTTLTDRFLLLKASIQVLLSHPLGIGLGNFILHLNHPSLPLFFPWEYQPVHSFFMLLLNELGIIGGISAIIFFLNIFFSFFQRMYIHRKLLFSELGIIMTFFLYALIDHFWLTSWTGFILLIVILGTIYSEESHDKLK